MQRTLSGLPLIGPLARRLLLRFRKRPADFSSKEYWDERYRSGGTSGAGSQDRLARFKAEVLNGFVAEHGVRNIIEFGCGDGLQLELADYPAYLGLDVSPAALDLCRRRHGQRPGFRFALVAERAAERADLVLSLDVIYHLTEDAVYSAYMHDLFAAARRWVIIYSSDTEDQSIGRADHVRHHRFTAWVAEHAPEWELYRHVPNRYPYTGDYDHESFADFYIYRSLREEGAGAMVAAVDGT